MDYEPRILVDECVNDMCFQAPRSRFYPTAIEKRVQLPLEDVFIRLFSLANEQVLILRWELRCPNYDCVETVKTYDSIPENLGGQVECPFGHTFVVEPSLIFPIFRIHPDYRATLLRLKKKLKSEETYLSQSVVSESDVSMQVLLQSPEILRLLQQYGGPSFQQYIVQGGITVNQNSNNNNRTISGSFGGNGFQGNVNLGDNVVQSATWGSTEQSKFDELLNAIKSHSDLSEEEKLDAVETLTDLKGKKDNGQLRESKLKSMWEVLPEVIKGLSVAGEVFLALHGA